MRRARDALVCAAGGDSHYLPANIVVRHWRLVLGKRVLQLLVLAYMVFCDIILFHNYATYESPTGYTNVWGVNSAGIRGIAGVNDSSLPYCDPARRDAYTWGDDFNEMEGELTGNFIALPQGCVPYSVLAHSKIEGSSFSAMTIDAWHPSNESRITHGRFIKLAERASFNIIHTYTVSWSSRGTTNPRTLVKDASGKVRFEFAEGEFISGITVGDVLQLAGVSLDDRNMAAWLRGGDPQEQAHYRATGAVLIVRMKYTNMRNWEWRPSSLCEITVEQLPGAWGWAGQREVFRGIEEGFAIHFSNYVRLQFVTSGSIGKFEWSKVLLSLVQGLVLFNAASWIVDSCARISIRRHSRPARRGAVAAEPELKGPPSRVDAHAADGSAGPLRRAVTVYGETVIILDPASDR